jgi:hypothetical protein
MGGLPSRIFIMQTISQEDRRIFENLFILEAANNHQGSVERGLEIIRQHGAVVRQNNVRAAIKPV